MHDWFNKRHYRHYFFILQLLHNTNRLPSLSESLLFLLHFSLYSFLIPHSNPLRLWIYMMKLRSCLFLFLFLFQSQYSTTLWYSMDCVSYSYGVRNDDPIHLLVPHFLLFFQPFEAHRLSSGDWKNSLCDRYYNTVINIFGNFLLILICEFFYFLLFIYTLNSVEMYFEYYYISDCLL